MSDFLVSSQEFEQDLTQALEWKEWTIKRKDAVRLLRAAAEELKGQRKNVNIAKLSGTSASIVGTGMAIGGAVAAFFTFGSSLILTAVGVALAATGGATTAGSVLAEHLLSKSQLRIVQNALDEDHEATKKVDELFKNIDKVSSTLLVAGKTTGGIATAVSSSVKTAFNTGSKVAAAAERGGVALFKTLGNVSRVAHVAGLAISVALLPLDIHTIVTTSIDVHKGSIPDVVKDINKMADELEAELKENERKMVEHKELTTMWSS